MNLLQKTLSFFGQKKLTLANSGAFYRFLFQSSYSNTYSNETLAMLYRKNELAFACINKIADVMNDAEIIVEKLNSKGEYERIIGHPMIGLLKRPNIEEVGSDLLRKVIQSENALGLAYFYLIRPRPNAVPTAVYVLNPNRVFPQVNYGNGTIEYFRYSTVLGKQIDIAPEDMLIKRRTDLTDEFGGLAPLSVAANTISGDENLTDYVNAFLDPKGGGGVPAGILKFKKTLSPEFAEIKRKMWNKNTRGDEVQVMDDDADFVPIGSKLSELNSGDLREQNEARICSVFGVPPILVGAYVGIKNTTANATAKSALKDFGINKISPELKIYREWLTWNFLPQFEDETDIKAEKIRVNFDLSQMVAFQEDLDAIHTRARSNFSAGGWTLNEFREATGKMPDKKGDYYLQPFNLNAVSPESRAAQAVRKIEQGTNPTEDVPKRFQLKAAGVHEFSSTQLDLSVAEKNIILDFGKEFISDDDLADSLEWEPREDKPHITVKFGLHAENADDLKALLAENQIAPFEVTLGKTSIFTGDDKDYDVVIIGVASPELFALNKLIAENLECTDTHPKYIPHLTLAYVKKGKGADYVGDKTFEGQKLLFDKITFSDKTRKKTTIKLTGAKSQKKTFDFDGLTLSREPNEIEKLIGLKSMVDELSGETEQLQTSLLKYRSALINQAVSAIKDLDTASVHGLTLERNEKLAKLLNKSLANSYEVGRNQIIREINLQKSQKSLPLLETKDLLDETEEKIAEVSDSVLAKILNEIQSRAINIFTALKLLDWDAADFFNELKKRLFGESEKFVSELAANSANLLIQTGRKDEILNYDGDAQTEYSAILDANLCEQCKPFDGLRSRTPEKDLPNVPNKNCLGGARCRCFWVLILD